MPPFIVVRAGKPEPVNFAGSPVDRGRPMCRRSLSLDCRSCLPLPKKRVPAGSGHPVYTPATGYGSSLLPVPFRGGPSRPESGSWSESAFTRSGTREFSTAIASSRGRTREGAPSGTRPGPIPASPGSSLPVEARARLGSCLGARWIQFENGRASFQVSRT